MSARFDIRVVNNNYLVSKKIGAGSFGEIYLATNITNNEQVAIKVESVHSSHPQLAYEAKVYKAISPGSGIPKVKYFGTEGKHEVLVMDLLGPSLEDLFTRCHRRWTLKTILLIAEQSLSRVAYIHSKGFIHRDIKPDNLLMGSRETEHQLYIIDFGLTKRFRDPKTCRHIPYRNDKNLTGTPRYASINTHKGIEQSRRDDLESLAYIFIYFCRGSLPWQGIQAANKEERYQKILERKQSISPEALCEGLHTPFYTFLKYTQNLGFETEPDYIYIRKLFRQLFLQQGYKHDYIFDWTEEVASTRKRIVLQKQEPARIILKEERIQPENYIEPIKISYPYAANPSSSFKYNKHYERIT